MYRREHEKPGLMLNCSALRAKISYKIQWIILWFFKICISALNIVYWILQRLQQVKRILRQMIEAHAEVDKGLSDFPSSI